MRKIDILSEITVKTGVAALVKNTVTTNGLYRAERDQQVALLADLARGLDELYNMPGTVVVDAGADGRTDFNEEEGQIEVAQVSMIRFLGAYRRAMVNAGKVSELAEPAKVHAWACKAFKLACPNSFEKSVKAGKVAAFVWDEELGKALMLDYDEDEALDNAEVDEEDQE
jgi:hypothetical protein